MINLREVSIERVERALAAELPRAAPRSLHERAESLVAIAERYDVPVDPVLLKWIHWPAADKEWSAAEWRQFCQRYREAREELRARGVNQTGDEGQVEAVCGHCAARLTAREFQTHECERKLCPHCLASEMHMLNGVWLCPHCGKVKV